MALIGTDEDLAFAGMLADAAREIAAPLFRAGLASHNKAGTGFDPVTEADRAIEARLRALIAERFADDGILGEEEAERPGRSGRTWILDPIDGTRAFIAGIPTWTVLIGLADKTGPRLSVIDQPHIGERYIGLDLDGRRHAVLEHAAQSRRLSVSAVRSLDEAVMTTTDPYLFEGAEADAFAALRGEVRLVRYGLDAYGYALMALGGIDLVVESGLQPWDVAALVPVIRGAGGVVTDWNGKDHVQTGQVLAAATPQLHEEALERLKACAL